MCLFYFKFVKGLLPQVLLFPIGWDTWWIPCKTSRLVMYVEFYYNVTSQGCPPCRSAGWNWKPHFGLRDVQTLCILNIRKKFSWIGWGSPWTDWTLTIRYDTSCRKRGGCWRLCVWSWLSGNFGKTVLRLTEIIRMYFDTSLKTSRRDYSGLSGPGWPVYYKSRKRELKAKLMNESVWWETKS